MEDPVRFHQERAAEADELISRLRKKLRWAVFGRVLIFLAIVVELYLTWGSSPIIPILATLFLTGGFLYLVRIHASMGEEKAFWERKASIHRSDLERAQGKVPEVQAAEPVDEDHPYAGDLDLFASKGLFSWLDRSFSKAGQRKLIRRLSDPSDDPASIQKTQEGVKELADKADERMECRAHGRKLEHLDPSTASPTTPAGSLPLFFRILVPLLMLGSLGATISGLISFQLFVFTLVLPLSLIGAYSRKVREGFREVEADREAVSGIRDLLQKIEAWECRSEYLEGLQSPLFTDRGVRASQAIKQLDRILEAYEARSNPFVGIGLNILLLWDIQCYERLRRWVELYGNERGKWVGTVTELDALFSLASISADHPSFTFPEPRSEGAVLEGEGMGHPLIPDEERVDNDLEIPFTGHIKIITGANMAGKSTFLRTVGVNWVLAKAGSAVCAKGMRFRPLALFSSMRTSDDLVEHESFFYAELKRLRMIVDELERGQELLILLDEILQGTNSEDKKEGSRRFLERILAYPVAGLIATHDLDLTKMEKSYPQRIENLCFETEMENGWSSFDHRLRKGVCRNMNASALMERMGIG